MQRKYGTMEQEEGAIRDHRHAEKRESGGDRQYTRLK